MTLEQLRASSRDQILAVAEKHGVSRVRVFGSFACGQARDDSDLDLLIERGSRRTPFFPGGLVAELEEILGRRVDVATERGFPARIRESVLRRGSAALKDIRRIEEYTVGGKQALLTSTLVQDGVIRSLQILAESGKRISEASRKQFPEIPWRKMAGFRNIAVHDYLYVDLE